MNCTQRLHTYPPRILYALTLSVLLACTLANVFISRVWVRTTEPKKTYTYLQDDFPESFPIGALPQASIFVANTVHYQINTTDAPDEWASLFPRGGGYVHLGEEQRPFLLSMYHQLYCLRHLKDTIATPSEQKTGSQLGRAQHCLNYIRQAILCEPSLRLEPESERIRDAGLPAGIDGLELVHSQCRDWTVAFKAVEENRARSRQGTKRDVVRGVVKKELYE